MKKGRWLVNLLLMTIQGKTSAVEAFNFALARFKPKPTSFSLQGIFFDNVDHTFWGIIADIFINRVYTTKAMEIHPNDVIVDVGAHRGGFTAYASKQTINTVIAIEPETHNYASLMALLKRNNLTNVKTYNFAIGPKTGSTNLYLSSSSSRHSLEVPKKVNRELKDKTVHVKMLSLDDCLANIETVNLLKMDCEGAEREILMNASKATLSKIQKLVLETHDSKDSQELIALRKRLEEYYTRVDFIDQNQQNLGYIYAWR